MLHTLTVLVRVIENELGQNYINNYCSLANDIRCYIINGNQIEPK